MRNAPPSGRARRAGAIVAACLAPLVLAPGVLALSAPANGAPAAPALTLYADASLIDGTGAPEKAHQDILVEGERILALGPHGTLAGASGARQVDLAGRFVIPGLIDSHVHLATPPNPPRAEAILRRDLYGGVTAVRDMADDLRPVGELKREALVGEIAAPDIFYAALMAGPAFFKDPRVQAVSVGVKVGAAPWMQEIDSDADLRTAVTLARGTSATAIKIYADLPATEVAAITAEAHRQHLRVWAHSAVFPARPADVVAADVDVLSHVCYMAYEIQKTIPAAYEDHTPVDERLLARTGDDPVMASLFRGMLAHGQILDATGSLFVRYDAERKSHPERPPLRCTGPAVIRLTRQAARMGVPISTGTDFAWGADRVWPEVDDELFFLAHDVGLSPLAVIHAATEVGAQAAGQEADMGVIAPGKLANFVVLTADPAADIGAIQKVDMTVKRGRVYRRADFKPPTAAEMGDGNDD